MRTSGAVPRATSKRSEREPGPGGTGPGSLSRHRDGLGAHAIPGGFFHPRPHDPPLVEIGGKTLDLDVGYFPWHAAHPDGGVVLLGKKSGVRVDAQGLLHPVPPAPPSAHNPALAVLSDGTLVQTGGTDGDGTPSVQAWILPSDGTWERAPNLPFPKVARTLEDLTVAVTDRLWLLGAKDDARVLSWAPGEKRWKSAEDAPFEPMEALPVGDRIWVMGRPSRGEQHVAWLDTDGTWSEPIPIEGIHERPATHVRDDGTIVVSGGRHSDDDYLGCTHAWVVEPESNTWTPLPPLPESRSGGSSITLPDGRIVLIGGDRSRVYWLDGETWVSGPPTLRHRGRTALSLLEDGRIAIAGGGGDGLENAVVELYDPGPEPVELPPAFESFEDDKWTARCLAGEQDACDEVGRENPFKQY